MTVRVVAYGIPAPQGSKRHVGKGIMVESSQRVKPWREAVKHAALRDDPEPLEGPLLAVVTFTFPKPVSAPKKRTVWPITRASGDIDKLLRCTFDALTDAGVWLDDSQVCSVLARKLYVGDLLALPIPGADIQVAQLIEAEVAA